MKRIMSIILASILCTVSGLCRGQGIDNSTVRSLDLERYLGTWYEIARFDHRFERGVAHAKAHYSLKPDGTISVINTGITTKGKDKTAVGKAKITDTPGLLRVSFFGPFYSDYRVMMLSDDYRYALVGSTSPNFLWILSRTAEVPEDQLEQILSVASDRGYNTEKLIWVEQYQD